MIFGYGLGLSGKSAPKWVGPEVRSNLRQQWEAFTALTLWWKWIPCSNSELRYLLLSTVFSGTLNNLWVYQCQFSISRVGSTSSSPFSYWYKRSPSFQTHQPPLSQDQEGTSFLFLFSMSNRNMTSFSESTKKGSSMYERRKNLERPFLSGCHLLDDTWGWYSAILYTMGFQST